MLDSTVTWSESARVRLPARTPRTSAQVSGHVETLIGDLGHLCTTSGVMGARVSVSVTLPGGSAAAGATIKAFNRNAWGPGARHWDGTTDSNGQHVWISMDTGWAGDLYDFEADFVDQQGVRWRGESTQRIEAPTTFVMGLAPYIPPVGDFSDALIAKLEAADGGAALLQAIGELEVARRSGLVLGVVSLGSHVIEGLIQVKCRLAGTWEERLASEPLGSLLREEPVRQVLPGGWIDKLEAFSRLRRPSVHAKGAVGQPEEASLTVGMVRGLAEELLGP